MSPGQKQLDSLRARAARCGWCLMPVVDTDGAAVVALAQAAHLRVARDLAAAEAVVEALERHHEARAGRQEVTP